MQKLGFCEAVDPGPKRIKKLMALLQKFDVILTFWTASADSRVGTSQRTHDHVDICAENDVAASSWGVPLVMGTLRNLSG